LFTLRRTGGSLFFFCPDHLGSGTLLTDANGDAYQFFVNLPFGETLAEQKASGAYNNVYKFTGKELDAETGLYYLGARYYSPVDGIFLSVDPLADHPNQVDKSPYAYAWNNPVRLTDPDGNCPFCPAIPVALKVFVVGFGIGATADVTTQAVTNKFQGKGAFEDYSFSSTVISGTFGGFTGGSSSAVRVGLMAAGESVTKQIITDDAANSALRGDFSKIQENASNVSATQVASDVVMDNVGGRARVFSKEDIKIKENDLDRFTRINNNNTRPSRVQRVQDAQAKLDRANNINDYVGESVGNGLQNMSDGARAGISTINGGTPMAMPPVMAQDNTRVNVILQIHNK
jgi:RHS repeat-associated protein